ncbi:MAG: fluoride efflux transporter CrcB [Desulfobacterales bacterium]|nr:MAG: fluoride efflux transporter CrcB [Desulfobacterales bacterium]
MTYKLFWIACAGALGSISRYLLTIGVQRVAGPGFPWGTTTVNIMGCFLFGLVSVIAVSRWEIGPDIKLIILAGFMGAFTTFSTFVAETGLLIENAAIFRAMGNLSVQVVGGMVAFFVGQMLGRLI